MSLHRDPIQVGVANNVVCEISVDREGLEWLAGLCPEGDGFTEDLHQALRQLDELEVIEAKEPGLHIEIALGGELRP